MQPPILVRHITHLTDARYFSAAGADWLSLDIGDDPAAIATWHAIREWVAGISLAAEPVGLSEEMWARLIIDARPDGVVIAPGTYDQVPVEIVRFVPVDASAVLTDLPADTRRIYQLDDVSRWTDLGLRDQDFIETAWTPDAVRYLLDSGYHGGFCLRGGSEEVVGVRDYTLSEDIMGLLRP